MFSNLSLRVPVGERLAVVGPSGAGKSTLLHLLSGLDRPSAGSIALLGENLGQMRSDQLARFQNRRLGFVWQTPSLLPEFTALENVMMPLLIREQHRLQASITALDLLDRLQLADRAENRAGELSGGEQQRVVVARALAGGPSVLMADEPTGSLDTATARTLMDLLWQVHASYKLTTVLVTHNLAFARECDRVLELGKLP